MELVSLTQSPVVGSKKPGTQSLQDVRQQASYRSCSLAPILQVGKGRLRGGKGALGPQPVLPSWLSSSAIPQPSSQAPNLLLPMEP